MTDTPTPDHQAELDAEAALWANVDATDPVAVARALAAVGARAGAKVAVLEHMNARVGRAISSLDEATAALHALVPRAEMEQALLQLRKDVDADRAKDQATSRRRLIGVVLALLTIAAVFLTGHLLNRAAIARAENQAEDMARRTEAVAICASSYPGDRDAISRCVRAELDD